MTTLNYERIDCQAKEKEQFIYFLHGWPDSVAIFRPYVEALSKDDANNPYTCINCAFPFYPQPADFVGKNDENHQPKSASSFTLMDVVEAFKNTIEQTRTPGALITVVGHDWGSVICYLLHEKYPTLIDRMVTFSLSPTKQNPSCGTVLYVMLYQFALFFAYCFRSICCTRIVASCMGKVKVKGEPGIQTSRINWPYRSLFADTLCCRGTVKRFQSYEPVNFPLLFFYEADAPCYRRATDASWIRCVQESSAVSRTEGIPGNHWMVYSQREKTIPIFKEWLATSNAFMVNKNRQSDVEQSV